MAGQVAIPKGDDLVGHWTPTPLFPHLDQQMPVTSGAGIEADTFEVKLAGLAYPDKGDNILTVVLAGDGSTLATVLLLQGNRIIAVYTFTPPAALTTYQRTLTPAQAALIGDYADLHVEVIAGTVAVACCPSPMPPVLTMTFSGATGGCGCLNGQSLAIAYGGSGSWPTQLNPGTFCGATVSGQLQCLSGAWNLNFGGCTMAAANPTVSGCGVGTTLIKFTGVAVGDCCAGTIDVTFTG